MPYHIIKKINLIRKSTATYPPVFAIDLEDERTWSIFKLYRRPSPDVQGQVVKLLNPDGTTRDSIKRSCVFPTDTTCNYTHDGDTSEKRQLLMPSELVRAFGICENMIIELILSKVIYHWDGADEKISIYEKMIEGPKDVVPIDDFKTGVKYGTNYESIKDQSKTLFEVIEKAQELGLDINWVISAISLQLQEIAVLKCAERANIKLDKNNLQQTLHRTVKEVATYLSFKDQYDILSFEIEKQKQIRLPQLTGDLRAMRVRVLHKGYNPETIETQAVAKFSVDLLDKLKGIT